LFRRLGPSPGRIFSPVHGGISVSFRTAFFFCFLSLARAEVKLFTFVHLFPFWQEILIPQLTFPSAFTSFIRWPQRPWTFVSPFMVPFSAFPGSTASSAVLPYACFPIFFNSFRVIGSCFPCRYSSHFSCRVFFLFLCVHPRANIPPPPVP